MLTEQIVSQKLAKYSIDETYDVVVVGGGLAGVCAAISAARHGCKTAIIQDRPVFGGVSSSEIRIAPDGAAAYNAWARETGIIEEIQLEERARNHEKFHKGLVNSIWDLILLEFLRAEKELSYCLNTVVVDVEMEGSDKIAAVIAVQLGSECRIRLAASLFIDCTGDGTVGALAGAQFQMGRETRSEFNESLAPEKADNKTQGSTLFFLARNAGHPVPFKPPCWAKDYPTEESLKWGHPPFSKNEYLGYNWIEIGAPFDTIYQNEEIRNELLGHLLGVWDHIKNHGDHGAENFALEWIGMVPGKRESRRLIGNLILTENDIRENKPFFDRVAYGGWYFDVHPMEGILAKPPSRVDFDLKVRIRPYNIPFRCLYSRNICNLLMAGRNISVSHIALGTTRIMRTCAILGQVVGTAASLCLKYIVFPRGITERYIDELQQTLLKDDCFILDMPNHDPGDLARCATATATSEAPLCLNPAGKFIPLDCDRSQIFPISTGHIEKIGLYLQSSLDKNAEVSMEFLSAADIWSFNEPHIKGPLVCKAIVPARFQGWVDFQVNNKVEAERLYRINVHAHEGIMWCTTKPTPGVSAAKKDRIGKLWISEKPIYAMRFDPPSSPFYSKNVINGVARPEKWTNIWISDPSQELPQSITLDFGKEITFNHIYITFDTRLHFDMGDFSYIQFPPLSRVSECVSDYSLQIYKDDRWQTICEITGNYQRRRIHRFALLTTSKLQLEIQKTNGDPSARVYEIRVYRE